MNASQQAQHVIDGMQAGEAFIEGLRTSSPTGDELLNVIKTYASFRADADRLFLRGFARTLQKRFENAPSQGFPE